jgi:hypothetical protein
MRDWFARYGLSEHEIEDRYVTVAARYYRDRLKARSDNLTFTEPEPDATQGAKPEAPILDPTSQTQPERQYSGICGFVQNIRAKTDQWRNEITAKAEEIKQHETFQKFEERWDQSVSGIKETTETVINSPAV